MYSNMGLHIAGGEIVMDVFEISLIGRTCAGFKGFSLIGVRECLTEHVYAHDLWGDIWTLSDVLLHFYNRRLQVNATCAVWVGKGLPSMYLRLCVKSHCMHF